jgi:hypothetical protein
MTRGQRDLYRAARGSTHPVGQDRVVFCFHESAEVVELPAALQRLLRLCVGARSLADHVGSIAAAYSIPEGDVREGVDTLERLNLLQPFAATSSGRSQRSRIGMLGILTCDRPLILARALSNAAHQLQQFNRDIAVVVVDGSRQPEHRVANQHIAASWTTRVGGRLTYIGATEVRQLIQLMGRGGFETSCLHPGLTTRTAGANRNVLLLLAAGRPMVMVDDDIRWDMWRFPGPEDVTVDFGGHHDLAETTFHSTRMDACAATQPASMDMLAAHEALLGMSPLDIAAQRPIDVSRACGHLLDGLSRDQGQRVRVTQLGLAGDAGVHCPYHLLFARGPVRDELESSREVFGRAITSREVVRATRRATVLHQSGCMAGCLGLDNTAVLPPFIPEGRNEDGVFGAVLRHADDSTLFGHLPWGIIHDSVRSSLREPGAIRSATQMRVSELVLLLLSASGGVVQSSSVSTRFQRLSAWFGELSHMASRDFRAFVIELVVAQRSRLMARLESEILADSSRSAWMREAAEQYRRECLAGLQHAESWCPSDLAHGGPEDAGQRLQEFLHDFSALLGLWPDLWSFAQERATTSALMASS